MHTVFIALDAKGVSTFYGENGIGKAVQNLFAEHRTVKKVASFKIDVFTSTVSVVTFVKRDVENYSSVQLWLTNDFRNVTRKYQFRKLGTKFDSFQLKTSWTECRELRGRYAMVIIYIWRRTVHLHHPVSQVSVVVKTVRVTKESSRLEAASTTASNYLEPLSKLTLFRNDFSCFSYLMLPNRRELFLIPTKSIISSVWW